MTNARGGSRPDRKAQNRVVMFSERGGWKLWACELAALPLFLIVWPIIWLYRAIGWIGEKFVE